MPYPAEREFPLLGTQISPVLVLRKHERVVECRRSSSTGFYGVNLSFDRERATDGQLQHAPDTSGRVSSATSCRPSGITYVLRHI